MKQEEYLKEFKTATDNMFAITSRKNQDYAESADTFKNFRQCELLGICRGDKGILVRMSDKMTRIANLLDHDSHVADEKIEDTLIDLSVYAIILSIYLKEQREMKKV